MNRFESEYQRLNPAQRQAVDAIEGPVLVVAGPGTGKTQLLSLRVANILRKTDVQAYNILCLTYTESGKEAMISRLADFLGPAAKKVEVHTFHGFGTRLINRFPDFFPELANFRPAEDLTLYEALRACLAALPRKNPLSRQAYGQFIYQADARDRISQLKQAGIAPQTAVQKAEADSSWCQLTGRKLTTAFRKTGRLSPKAIDMLAKDLEPLLNDGGDSELGRECLEQLSAAITESQASGKTAALSVFKKLWFSSEAGQLYFKPTDQIKKLSALAELYDDYENELKRRQIYDYDDMILFALEKLKNNPEFLSQVQENFQYILADEYQDTNAAQASIINLIADNPVNEGRPNVMVVGDDDQAIYGFQGALGDVLIDFRERWRAVKVVILKENYRSTEHILSTARSIITQGKNRLESHYEDIDKTLIAKAPHPNVDPLIIAANSANAVIDKAVGSAKSADENHQLAIIATKHKYLLELASRLDAAKINYFYEGHEDLLKDESIVKILLLAELLLAIRQKKYERTNYLLPEIIASDIFNISREMAWQLAIKAKSDRSNWWQCMKTMTEPKTKEAYKIIKDLANKLDIKEAADSLKLTARVFKIRAVQRIQQLNKHAVAYFGRNDISLADIIRYSQLCQQAGVSLDFRVVKGKQQAPVVLLSAHKSKGLEFDRVYILHADYHTWFKEGGRRNNLTMPPGWSAVEPQATNNDDKLRLLYVVMTRAKQELVMVKDDSKALIPGLETIKSEQYISEQLEFYSLPEEKSWRQWYLPKTPQEKVALKQLLQPSLDNYHLSATHLTIYLDVGRGGPNNFLTGILLGIREPVQAEAIFGSLVHRSIRFAQEHLNKNGTLPSNSQLNKFVKSEAANWPEVYTDDIVQVVTDFLDHNNILQPGGISEYSFSNQNLEWEGKKLTGTVDQFIIENKELTLVDFKTGRALNSWHVTEDYYKQKLHRFRLQLLFYELLFNLSPEFEFTKITSKVVFVEPTRRDVYYQLTLEPDHNEKKRLLNLINSVWNHIINLELPKIEQYSLDAKGQLDFEDDLINNQI